MSRAFSNGPLKDFVVKPYEDLVSRSSRVYAAAPYVTETGELLEAARKGKAVDLLVGLNSSTSPDALKAIIDEPNIRIRYYTDRFHAKIYLFDDAALVGSSNLTDGGLRSNREATVLLRAPDDAEIIQELRTIFNGLWEPAPVLTQHRLKTFADAYKRHPRPDIDGFIQAAVGKSVPPNISIESQQKNAERIFLESLRKQVAEYRNSFNEVTAILGESHLKRPELDGLDAAMQTDRFLNWVRNSYAIKGTWEDAPLRPSSERRSEIITLGKEWAQPDRESTPEGYVTGINRIREVFGAVDRIDDASKQVLTEGLAAIHAFAEHYRYEKKEVGLLVAFWNDNDGDVLKVKKSLKYLIYGGSEFEERLHDVLYGGLKLRGIGPSSALELYGTLKPQECPPINGATAKALRYLGFNVQTV
jgi:hypothetical protein